MKNYFIIFGDYGFGYEAIDFFEDKESARINLSEYKDTGAGSYIMQAFYTDDPLSECPRV